MATSNYAFLEESPIKKPAKKSLLSSVRDVLMIFASIAIIATAAVWILRPSGTSNVGSVPAVASVNTTLKVDSECLVTEEQLPLFPPGFTVSDACALLAERNNVLSRRSEVEAESVEVEARADEVPRVIVCKYQPKPAPSIGVWKPVSMDGDLTGVTISDPKTWSSLGKYEQSCSMDANYPRPCNDLTSNCVMPWKCMLGPWTNDGECVNGQQNQVREILKPAMYGNTGCGSLTQTITCEMLMDFDDISLPAVGYDSST
jgi:hypothetical protein